MPNEFRVQAIRKFEIGRSNVYPKMACGPPITNFDPRDSAAAFHLNNRLMEGRMTHKLESARKIGYSRQTTLSIRYPLFDMPRGD